MQRSSNVSAIYQGVRQTPADSIYNWDLLCLIYNA